MDPGKTHKELTTRWRLTLQGFARTYIDFIRPPCKYNIYRAMMPVYYRWIHSPHLRRSDIFM